MTQQTVRRARPEDAAELARLRELMYVAMGSWRDTPGWRQQCTEHFATRIAAEPDTFVVFVVDGDQPGTLAASGAGWLDRHLPSLRNVQGYKGYIASMSTDQEHQRRGYARAIVEALLAWFTEKGVGVVDLHASGMGEPLYRSMGFVDPTQPALVWVNPLT